MNAALQSRTDTDLEKIEAYVKRESRGNIGVGHLGQWYCDALTSLPDPVYVELFEALKRNDDGLVSALVRLSFIEYYGSQSGVSKKAGVK